MKSRPAASSSVALVFAVIALAALQGCSKANSRYCESNGDCPSNQCDLPNHRCVEGSGDGGTGADAMVDAAPMGCRGPSDCMGAKSICLGADAGMGGMCVECAGHDDCSNQMRPTCVLNRCEPCATDMQCMSRAESSTIGLCEDGRCLRPQDVAIVAGTPGVADCASRDGTTAKPYCTLGSALANEGQKGIFHLKPGGTYSSLVTIEGKNVTIFGRKTRMNAPGTRELFDIDMGSRVTLRGLEITNVNTSGSAADGIGVLCDEMGTRCIIDQCSIDGTLGVGIHINNASLDLTRSKIISNASGGVLLTGVFGSANPTFMIENNFFYKNGGSSSGFAAPFGAISIENLGTGTPTTIRHNSFFDNRAMTITMQRSGSIACGFVATRSAMITNNIITGNIPLEIGSPYPTPGCATFDSLVNDPAFATINQNRTGDPRYLSAVTGDLHLTTSSAAKDVANPANAPSLDIDGERRGSMPDLGADELP